MTTRSKNIAGLLLILTLGFTLACGGGDKDKANKAMSESNALQAEYEKNEQDGATKMGQLTSSGNIDTEERQKNESMAKEILNSFTSAKAKASEGAQKLEDASKLNLDAWHKEYFSIGSQEFRQMSKFMDIQIEQIKAYMDYSLDADALMQKFEGFSEQAAKAQSEIKALEAKVQKIHDEHKADFQK